jgi:hypothetical protein
LRSIVTHIKGELPMHVNKIRNPIGVFFLGFITFGIYYWHWFYSVNSEAATITNDQKAKPGLSLLAATLGGLLIVPAIWTHWTTAQRVGNATGQPAGTVANVFFSIVLFPFVGLFYTYWVQGKLNKYARGQHFQASQVAPQPAL